MFEALKLSLATFQPEKCYHPYLNTPRSLEACRLNGVNPVELVEIPFSEFQKDHPNDPDAASRRYERVDGARRRILAQVMKDWRQLCQSGWVPVENRTKVAKESIVDVPAIAHCTLLELQAQKFRKLEQDNWIALQRNLRIEIAKADSEVRQRKIVEKHAEIQAQNDETKRERQAKRDALIAEQVQRLREDEERRMAEIKSQQEEAQREALFTAEERKQNAIKEKQMREKREADRVSREEYTKQMKGSILAGIESQLKHRKQMQDLREKNDEMRVKEVKNRKDRELEERKKHTEMRLVQTREEKRRHLEETQRMVSLICYLRDRIHCSSIMATTGTVGRKGGRASKTSTSR
jgi:hypothetical protein